MSNIKIYAFADESSEQIDAQISAMQKNSLDGLEIRNVDGTNISDITKEKALEVRKKLESAGLITWSLGSPIGKIDIVSDNFQAHLEKFKYTLELGNILNARNIRIFSFYIPHDANPNDFRNKVIERLGIFAELAKDSGITLCHENEKGIYGDTAPRCLELHRAVPALKSVFDPANFVQCGQDTLVAWNLLHPYVEYMHIKDSSSDGTVVPAGLGDGNIPFLASAYLRQGGYVFTIEPHLADFSGLANLERSGEKSNIGGKYTFSSNEAAFDTACGTFKKLLEESQLWK